MAPTLRRVAGNENTFITNAVTGAEDFAYFKNEISGFFYRLGGVPKGMDPKDAAP